MEQVNAFYARQLEQYRKLPGNRIEKLRFIKELRATMGDNITLGRLSSQISLALDLERKDKFNNINLLSEKGYSLHKISNELGIPKSTVSRYLKKISIEAEKEISSPSSRVLPLQKRRT